MSKIITISIDETSLELLDKIVKKEFTDRSKIIRKWIYNYIEVNGFEVED